MNTVNVVKKREVKIWCVLGKKKKKKAIIKSEMARV